MHDAHIIHIHSTNYKNNSVKESIDYSKYKKNTHNYYFDTELKFVPYALMGDRTYSLYQVWKITV